MLKMKRFENDLKKYIEFLKESVSKPLIRMGIDIIQDTSTVGLWANHPLKGRAKIAFIGIRIRKGVSFHGISININPDLKAFSIIVPCGIREEKITSVAELMPPLEIC
jgi:lipoyl(octanoyl) transferase